MMRVRVSLKPGQPGTESLLARYGKSLVCVRYRYDERTKQRRVKTGELIVDRSSWQPQVRRPGDEILAVRVDWHESELRQKVKAAGGKWDPVKLVWRLGREHVGNLELESRIVEGAL